MIVTIIHTHNMIVTIIHTRNHMFTHTFSHTQSHTSKPFRAINAAGRHAVPAVARVLERGTMGQHTVETHVAVQAPSHVPVVRLLRWYESAPGTSLSAASLAMAYLWMLKKVPDHQIVDVLRVEVRGHPDCERLPPLVRIALSTETAAWKRRQQ